MSSYYIIFIFVLLLTGGYIDSITPNCHSEQKRTIAAEQCRQLFSNSNPLITQKISFVTAKALKELSPNELSQNFWELVQGLSLNESLRLSLDANSSFVLGDRIKDTNYVIYISYVKNPLTQFFEADKVKIRNVATAEDVVKESSVRSMSNEQALVMINSGLSEYIKKPIEKVALLRQVESAAYLKVESQKNFLKFFTARELYELSLLPAKERALRYFLVSKYRYLKGAIIDGFIQKNITTPILTAAFAVISISGTATMNQLNVHYKTPDWVAPNVVQMAPRYNPEIQKELVELMTSINAQKKPISKDVIKNTAGSLTNFKINDSDFLDVRKSGDKFYFIMTHQNKDNEFELFIFELVESKHSNLINYFYKPNDKGSE